MTNPVRKAGEIRHFHVGAKTRAFDALGVDLIVLATEEGVSPGALQRLPGRQSVSARTRLEAGQKGFAAFDPVDGGVYCAEGVEYRPVAVTHYFRYDAAVGFQPLTEAQAIAASTPKPDETRPKLVGVREKIAEATPVREAMVVLLERAGRSDLLPRLLWHTLSAWFVKHRDLSCADLIALLETEKAPNPGKAA